MTHNEPHLQIQWHTQWHTYTQWHRQWHTQTQWHRQWHTQTHIQSHNNNDQNFTVMRPISNIKSILVINKKY